jgi:hypothetical protein
MFDQEDVNVLIKEILSQETAPLENVVKLFYKSFQHREIFQIACGLCTMIREKVIISFHNTFVIYPHKFFHIVFLGPIILCFQVFGLEMRFISYFILWDMFKEYMDKENQVKKNKSMFYLMNLLEGFDLIACLWPKNSVFKQNYSKNLKTLKKAFS